MSEPLGQLIGSQKAALQQQEHYPEDELKLDEPLTKRDLIELMSVIKDTNDKLLGESNFSSKTANMSLSVLYISLSHYIRGTVE